MKQIINGIEITINVKSTPTSINNLLENYKIDTVNKVGKKKHCHYEWQNRAFEMADKLKIDFNKKELKDKFLKNWLSLFKRAYSSGRIGRLESCYSFLIDYTKNIDDQSKIKLFFWRYGQLKKDK